MAQRLLGRAVSSIFDSRFSLIFMWQYPALSGFTGFSPFYRGAARRPVPSYLRNANKIKSWFFD